MSELSLESVNSRKFLHRLGNIMLITAHCVYCKGSCKARCSRTMFVRCWPRRWLQAWLLCGRGVMRSRCQHRAPTLSCALQEEDVLPPQPRALHISAH